MIVNKNMIFLGAPGTGKGTVSQKLEEKFNIMHISTGDIFREEIKNKTELGLKVQEIVNSGEYVPDEITNLIVKNKLLSLDANNKNFILDGFPRTIQQAKFLNSLNLKDFIIINLFLSDKLIVKRLSSRLFCEKCKKIFNTSTYKEKKCNIDETILIKRKDDEEEAILKRLKVYNDQTLPLVEYYENNFSNNFFSISSDNSLDKIIEEIFNKIK